MEIINDYAKFGELQISTHEGGEAVMGFAVAGRLWMRGTESREQRDAVLDALLDYQQLFPDHVTQYQKNNATRMSRIGSGGFKATYQAEIEAIDPSVFAWGPNIEGEVKTGGYGARALTTREQSKDRTPLGYFDARFPAHMVATTPDMAVQAVLRWSDKLKPDQGAFGLAPVFETGMGTSHPNVVWPFLARFNGLDYNWAFNIAVRAQRGIKGVSWLTVIDDEYVEDLGGRSALATSLGDKITLHEYEGGVLIQAGAEPQIGDNNMGVWPEEYILVNNALRPIRFEEYSSSPVVLIAVPEPLDAHEETLKWVRRFDGRL